MCETWRKMVISMTAAVLFAVPLGLLLKADLAESTPELMTKLPVYSRYQCVLCHTTALPTEQVNALNLFGKDFRTNENIWNLALAVKNSDGDACRNGFELGDRDGDGKLDPGIKMEQSNPGNNQDCSVALTESTWGIIKRLFADE